MPVERSYLIGDGLGGCFKLILLKIPGRRYNFYSLRIGKMFFTGQYDYVNLHESFKSGIVIRSISYGGKMLVTV